eukprot:GEZU01018337.1.p1 GENE.GEZU01018337.1~~GEZU01018337.1.p1  ORF type:complete len:285 (+),score=61.96 GEZU01018337.1:344-1198(+)
MHENSQTKQEPMQRSVVIDKWFTFFIPPTPPKDGPKLRLFCFPYAGGSAAVFSDWCRLLPNDIEVVGVTLPGRLHRAMEKDYYRDVCKAAYDITNAILPFIQEEDNNNNNNLQGKKALPYAIYGHSLGSQISFEVMRELRRRGKKLPVMAFPAGCGAPSVARSTNIGSYTQEQFVNLLRDVGGTPKEILDNPEFWDLIVPHTQADWSMLDNYSCTKEDPFDIPMVLFMGIEDFIPLHEQQEWRIHTTKQFTVYTLPGNHFFLHKDQSQETMVALIHQKLQPFLS